MANVFDYIFNIGGNFTAQISGMSAAAGKFSAQAEVAESRGKRLAAALASFSYLKDIVQNVTEGITQLSGAGVKLDSQMHDLSAVAGVTGDSLKQIEGFARESAKTFGTDASVAVEGYKLLLSQLSPELGKYPEALREMGDCIQTTSKLMGNDGAAAAEVLTTAMNQFGVSMEDPTAAAEKMGEMMNVMAAAGQAGSAELPAISAAFHVLDKPQEIKEVFSNINNQYSYTDMSKRTENTIYNFSKFFYETRNNLNRIIENNTCFYTFSNVVSPTVKPGDHIFNCLNHSTENLSNNTMYYNEELNSLAMPSYSTTFNSFRGILMIEPFSNIGKRVSEPIKEVNGLWERNDYSAPKQFMRERKRDFIKDTLKGRVIPESEEWYIRNKQQEEPLRRNEIAVLVETAIIDLLR